MPIKDRWCSCTRLREAEEKAAKWDEVVTCEECIYLCENDSRWRCLVFYADIAYNDGRKPNGFCAWGERRQP